LRFTMFPLTQKKITNNRDLTREYELNKRVSNS
jgi:hypothetical protein